MKGANTATKGSSDTIQVKNPTSSGSLDRGLRARFIAWSHFPEPTSSTTDNTNATRFPLG